jgi:predicted secreted Zn-dependent protease
LTPSALPLTNAPEGLTKTVDAPQQYVINGNTPDQLRTQIQQCAPNTSGDGAAEFTAETTYQLNWQYSIVVNGAGSCSILHPKVGVHIRQVVPLWQPTVSAQTGLSLQWQTFMSSLMTHENGHVAIDEQYAQTLLDDLRNFPPTDCGQLAGSVKHLADSDVATLNQANDNYDSATNHGATQGAILP